MSLSVRKTSELAVVSLPTEGETKMLIYVEITRDRYDSSTTMAGAAVGLHISFRDAELFLENLTSKGYLIRSLHPEYDKLYSLSEKGAAWVSSSEQADERRILRSRI
jgi:hypothetical protein